MTWHTMPKFWNGSQSKTSQKPPRQAECNYMSSTCDAEHVQKNKFNKFMLRSMTRNMFQIALSTICNYNSARTRWSITCRSSMWRSSPLSEAHRHCMHKPAGLIPAGIVDMNTDILVSQCTTRNTNNLMHTQAGSCTNVKQRHEDGDIF